MFRILIVDDSFEDRELLRLEIENAVGKEAEELGFYEAQSVKRARELLRDRHFDLMTLDIEFDRLNEGLDALPAFFEENPTLNIIVISGKLNKAEVTEQLFRFTKDNVLKGKRWARHFDVLDKKDDKTEAIKRAFSFALGKKEVSEQLKELFILAESYMEKGDMEKCLEVYRKIQGLAPGEKESGENILIFEGQASAERAREYMKKGERVIAALLFGHYLENRLKTYTKKTVGRSVPGLYDCLKELERSHRFSHYKKSIFHQILKIRNKAIHHPASFREEDFEAAEKNLRLLEARF